MLERQNPYDFKVNLLQIHKRGIRCTSLRPLKDEFEIKDGIAIVLPNNNEIILTAARDFEDYLLCSMQISALITYEPLPEKQNILISICQDIGTASGYMGSRIYIDTSGITIEAYDERGAAQAFYYLEDLMNLKKAPYLKKGKIERKALFSPRITQSPFGMYEYPDEAFAHMAHLGYDAIDLWLKDACTDLRGYYIDLRLLSERAAKYGIDLYVELYAPHKVHPDEAGAQEFYDNLYGSLFAHCPNLKGITLLGEANQFHSKDPHVGKAPYAKNFEDNIPTGKESPGWYPCADYPKWVSMIQKAVYRYNPNADIIFWTYNWGFVKEEERIRLIENLPDGISLMATWEMFHKYSMGESVGYVADYTLSFDGPGEYFTSEAIAAKKRGMRLYAMANTSGRTWDLGVIPYEPMPQQWIKRYEKIIKARSDWGLCGLLENIHYGFHPSIISDLEKCALFTHEESLTTLFHQLCIRDYGEENARTAETAMDSFSKAVTHFIPSNEEQYGAFRIGPSFPLWTGNTGGYPEAGKIPAHPHAMFGNGIYASVYTTDLAGRASLPGVRIFDELASLEQAEQLMENGLTLLKSCQNPNTALLQLINLSEFIRNSIRTGIHVKQLYILLQKLNIAKSAENAEQLLDELEQLLQAERQNVEDTIPLVQADSRLGWEPSMEYTTDEKCLRWKLRQLDYEQNICLPNYRKSNRMRIQADDSK